jgi:hypothetical protein
LIDRDLVARNIKLGTNSIAIKDAFLAHNGVRIDALFGLRRSRIEIGTQQGPLIRSSATEIMLNHRCSYGSDWWLDLL